MSKGLNDSHGSVCTGWVEGLFSEAPFLFMWQSILLISSSMCIRKNILYPGWYLCGKSPCSLTFQRIHTLPLLRQAWDFPSQYLTLAGSVCGRHQSWSAGSQHIGCSSSSMVLIGWVPKSVAWPLGKRSWLWLILSLFVRSAFHLYTISYFFKINFFED